MADNGTAAPPAHATGPSDLDRRGGLFLEAARSLSASPATVHAKMKRYRISPLEFENIGAGMRPPAGVARDPARPRTSRRRSR